MHNIWEKIFDHLNKNINPNDRELWLKEINFVSYKNNCLELSVPNKFFKDWIEDNCFPLLKDYFSINYNTGVTLKLNITKPDGEGSENVIIEKIKNETLFKKVNKPNTLNPKYTFSTFVVGKHTRFAQAACEAVANEPGEVYNPLFIYGGVGLGKTHLLHAIGNHIANVNPKLKILYITADKFMNEMIESIRHDKNFEFRQKYRTLDVLLIDDIQFIAGKESTQEEFFHTFNTLHESRKQIVISSDSTPKEIAKLEERLRSRFEWGVIADVKAPDFETRVAILRRKADLDNIKASDEVINFIASKIKANIRNLEGSLLRVAAYADVHGTEITSTLAKEVLKDVIKDEPISQSINIDIIQEITAKHFNITKEHILNKNRNESIVLPRQIAIYISKELTHLSITEIGRKFGGRDHTTIMYAYNKINDKIKTDPYFSSLINKIITEIKNHL